MQTVLANQQNSLNKLLELSKQDRLLQLIQTKESINIDKDGDKKEPMKKAVADKKKVKEAAKPDFLDIDKDGDKKEPMKKAIADKKAKKGTDESGQVKDCPKCGAPGKKKLMACSSCGCS